MKKFFLLLVSALMLASCGPSVDELKQGIVETETNGLPMTIQKMEGVVSITIDTLIFINNTEPYYGYLVTTWDVNERHTNSTKEFIRTDELYSYKRVQKKLNVEVTDVHKSGYRHFQWRTNWVDAYIQAREGDSYKEDSYGGTDPYDETENIEDMENYIYD